MFDVRTYSSTIAAIHYTAVVVTNTASAAAARAYWLYYRVWLTVGQAYVLSAVRPAAGLPLHFYYYDVRTPLGSSVALTASAYTVPTGKRGAGGGRQPTSAKPRIILCCL